MLQNDFFSSILRFFVNPVIAKYHNQRHQPTIQTISYTIDDSTKDNKNHQSSSPMSVRRNLTNSAQELGEMLMRKHGVHSVNHMGAAGFKYTGVGDTARCPDCGLEISDWTTDMLPFNIHSERRPDCTFVRSIKPLNIASTSSSSSSIQTNLARTTSQLNEPEKPSKRQKIENTKDTDPSSIFSEVEPLKDVRVRTFSHWPHRTSPSKAQMIEAGFFNCNVGDRVICLYCNLICQQWTPHTDDPCEVHKTLRPQCPFVLAMLIRREAASILIVNENSTINRSPTASATTETFRSNEIVLTAACNVAYTEIPKRHASFATWPNENLPPVEDLVRAGFFYTGTKTIVTCFYCNGSLQNWGPNDNPTIEHARWFPHCAYAKQLCGDDLYRKIQESKRTAQERGRANETKEKSASDVTPDNTNSGSQKLQIPDESTLSRLVAARLDLPISQSLLTRNVKLSIIKRCWEDQLRLKQDDFLSDCDLLIACTILQKQIEHIDGKKENIIIPSVQMKKAREQAEKERTETLAREQAAASSSSVPNLTQSLPTAASNVTDVEMTTSSQSFTNESTSSRSSIESTQKPGSTPAGNTAEEGKANKLAATTASEQEPSSGSSPVNPCVLCWSEEKRLACIPCGHLATCVPCGHSLRSCPMCRREIELASARQRAATFTENEMTTIQRQQSLRDWSHLPPSPRDMANAGWARDTTLPGNHTICLHCNVRHHDWNADDDPLLIHRELSPLCSFVLSPHPIGASSKLIRTTEKMFPSETIAIDVAQPSSKVILPTEEKYSPPRRAQTFHCFPGGPPANTEALVASGFFFTGKNTEIQCHHCKGTVADLHQQPANQIDALHRRLFPGCHLAQLLLDDNQAVGQRTTEKCLWCFKNERRLVASPCHDLIVCRECARLILICPKCQAPVHALFEIYP